MASEQLRYIISARPTLTTGHLRQTLLLFQNNAWIPFFLPKWFQQGLKKCMTQCFEFSKDLLSLENWEWKDREGILNFSKSNLFKWFTQIKSVFGRCPQQARRSQDSRRPSSQTHIRCEQMTKVRLSSKYKVLPFSLSRAIGAYCIKSKHRVIRHIREA